ncbi:MAG: short-chain dehydrogenase [Peptococcaceae bacterium BRH_c4b]|nr:MAG: short-chain dehydrogenase [Peptococcaceae bacterium BRH_c4b]
MGRVDNKVAIVTGGSIGLGRSICELLAKEGAKVAVTDILDKEGQNLVDEIKAAGGTANFWHLDVANEGQVTSVFDEVAKTFGKIDVLVNNAGIGDFPSTPTHELTLERWNKVMDVNVNGVFLCVKAAIPYMLKSGGGSIINISSIYGLVSAPDIPAYHASKGAVRLMTKTDALLYAKQNIRVNSVHPGFIWTDLVQNYLTTSGLTLEAGREILNELHPVGHPGEPDDIGWGVVYLASDESKFVTGSELVIDGGYTAR